MILDIVYITREQITGTERMDCSLADARELAERSVKSSAADRVEILDESGTKLAHYPRVLRRA